MSLLILIATLGCRNKDSSVDTSGLVEDDTGTLIDNDGDGVGAASDCDDDDAAVYPGADEICDGLDNDCDGRVDVDAVDAPTWYVDTDGDGYGAGEGTQDCAQPSGSVELDGDCDDSDPAYHPGATEDDCADPNDYNCDGSVGYADNDGDGYAACEECDDDSAEVNPDATEFCDDIDNNCDGEVDEDTAADAATWYTDADSDGYGDPASSSVACEAPSGAVADGSDCDDAQAEINPGATELCNEVDDDCDGVTDEADAADASTWYVDGDGDGFGDASSTTQACDQPSGYLADATDCDDSDASVNPDGSEVCNFGDDDCDGSVDEEASDASTWYTDADSDGYGDSASSTEACTQPSGSVGNALDCDDGDAAISPAESELCNGVDDDCDGDTDEDDAADASTWYIDYDGDGYGSTDYTTTACDEPSGWTSDSSDCDDTDADVSPAGTETCNEVDDDCDGTVDNNATDATDWYPDLDCDGFGDDSASATTQCEAPSGYVDDNTDCDDSDGLVNTDAYEICDGADTDCDGTADTDCSDPTLISSPSHGEVESPSHNGACSLIGEFSTSANPHYTANLSTYMTALESATYSDTDTVDELDYSNRCGSDYAASTGNYSSSTNDWPTLSGTSSSGAGRFRGYINITCDDPLNYTMGLIGNDALSFSIEGTEVLSVQWSDGQWKKFTYVSFPEPGLYAFEVQWSTNLNCAIDPFELVWAEGFISGYDDYDSMCSGSSCTYGDGVNIPGFSIVDSDHLVQSSTGDVTDCAQCTTSADCASGESCNSAGICE